MKKPNKERPQNRPGSLKLGLPCRASARFAMAYLLLVDRFGIRKSTMLSFVIDL